MSLESRWPSGALRIVVRGGLPGTLLLPAAPASVSPFRSPLCKISLDFLFLNCGIDNRILLILVGAAAVPF
jgi:hypothetical protein